MPNKPLTIDVTAQATPNGSLDKWVPLGNTTIFIQSILTPQLDKKTNIGQLVSGIPTAFARVDLFKKAIEYVANSTAEMREQKTRNLLTYYEQLVDEWRGLIACIALDYAHISVRKIDLAYSDGATMNQTANVYEPKGAFGNMLLKRKPLWMEQNATQNSKAVPFINVIKYRGQVVGASSPECLLFTSTGYKCEPAADRPWISVETGKFIDPVKSVMNADQVAALHAYIEHLIHGLDGMRQYYNQGSHQLTVDYTAIRNELRKWQDEVAAYAAREGYNNIDRGTIPPVNADFSEPFRDLFCHKDILYGVEGVITEIDGKGAIEFDPKNLLLDDSAQPARLNLNISKEDLQNLPILVMTATQKGSDKEMYFALPLSALGLNVFGKNVASLVGMSGGTGTIPSTLKATFDPSLMKDNLEVNLTIVTNTGIRRTFRKVYTTNSAISNKDILIWPNFISPQWNAYYMYSELPHNVSSEGYRAFPFVGQMQDDYFRIVVDEKSNEPILLSEDGRITASKEIVDAELLVMSNDNTAGNRYQYEIYRSNKPFKGVRLQTPTSNDGGYLLINYSSSQGSLLPRDLMLPGATPMLTEVRLGVDFGSTNTSIAYSTGQKESGITFKNQRVSLMGNELRSNMANTKENQVFFFQGYGSDTESNAIKSVLTLHDPHRLPKQKQGESPTMILSREVVGGFPSFSDNLPFFTSDEKTITLKYPNGVDQVTQIHNMKWEDNELDKAYKSAYLRTLMLHVYAALFEEKKVPTSLKWSFPSSMKGPLLYSYEDIWRSLSDISPVLHTDGNKYPLTISKYMNAGSIGSFNSGEFGSTQESATPAAPTQGGFGGGQGSFGGGFGSGSFGSAETATPAPAAQGGFGGGSFGGGFGGNDSGFGGSFGGGTSFNGGENMAPEAEEPKGFMPDDPERKIEYDPALLYKNVTNDNPSLSEAEAVANFVVANHSRAVNVLTLNFDVGGSTTDISALFNLRNGDVTMIKQNSIRFAAQRVSEAVGHFPNFKDVLNQIAQKYKLRMVGLNYGPDSYNEKTAPYFFNQIVNRLDDSQLEDLYRNIVSNCPGLMCVNLYVTGLLMFYAGQMAHKLVEDLKRTSDQEWPAKQRPLVRITFAGKGSRLFQWLQVVNPSAAQEYYTGSFVLGYGRQALLNNLQNWPQIILPELGNKFIKYEVSMGLAKGDTELFKPTKDTPSEIIGETGFRVLGEDQQWREVDFINSLTPEMIQMIGIKFVKQPGSNAQGKFRQFCEFFYSAAQTLFQWSVNPNVLANACDQLDVTGYVQQMEEYRLSERESRGGKPFNFVAPLIILEGMKFYEDNLMKLL